jgi:hypothetical protein
MDRLSDFDRTTFYATGAIGDRELRGYIERGRRLQRDAVRGAVKDAGRRFRRAVSGWGELRLSHPRSRVGC